LAEKEIDMSSSGGHYGANPNPPFNSEGILEESRLPASVVSSSRHLKPSGGDDSVAMVAALASIAGNGEITLGHGTFLWNTEVPKLVRNATGIVIGGSGTDVTTIKLSEAAPRAFDFNKVADYDTFQNIELRDLTIDCNNVGGIHHTVIGTKQNGVDQYLLNFNRVRLRRIKTINVPSCQTLGSVVTTVNHRLNVFFASWHHGYIGSDTQTNLTNILLEDCNFEGGNVGAAVLGSGGQSGAGQPTALTAVPSGSGGTLPANTYYYRVVTFDSEGRPSPVSTEVTATTTGTTSSVALAWTEPAGTTGTFWVFRGTEYGRENEYYVVSGAHEYTDTYAAATKGKMPIGVNAFIDNVTFNRCRWTGLGVLTEYAAQEGFQIGGRGYGGRYEIKDCYAYGSGDNCFEVDGHSYALLDNCLADGIGGATVDGYTLAGFSTPLDQQETIYRNCRARMAEAETGNPRGWGINAIDSASSVVGAFVGPVTLQGCRAYDPSSTWGANGRLVRVNGDLPSLKLLDTRLIAPKKFVVLSGTTNEWLISWVGVTELNRVRLVIRDLSIDVQGSVKLEGHGETHGYLLKENTFELDVDNFVSTFNLPGSGTHSHEGISLVGGAGTVLAPSIIRRYKPSQVGDAGAYGLHIGDTSHLVINDKLVLEDCDFTSLGNGSNELKFDATSNAAKVFLIRPRMHLAFPIERSTISVTASPFSYQNLDGYPELVTVVGGTVSKIEYQTGEAHFVELGVVAGAFRLDNADTLKVTYSGAPTMIKQPLNK
jgi:hypothetical protein